MWLDILQHRPYLKGITRMALGTENMPLGQLSITVIALTGDSPVPFSILTKLDTLSDHCLALFDLKHDVPWHL